MTVCTAAKLVYDALMMTLTGWCKVSGDYARESFRKGKQRDKFIFIAGGVVSGIGKGITAASLGRLLKQGIKGRITKLDRIMWIGTMSPFNMVKSS